MSLINLTNENFNDLIKEGITLVDFYADWCGPCKMLGPVLEDLAKETDAKIVKVNVDAKGEIAQTYGVMSIPAIFLFKDGQLVGQQVGFQTKDMLINFIEQAK